MTAWIAHDLSLALVCLPFVVNGPVDLVKHFETSVVLDIDFKLVTCVVIIEFRSVVQVDICAGPFLINTLSSTAVFATEQWLNSFEFIWRLESCEWFCLS